MAFLDYWWGRPRVQNSDGSYNVYCKRCGRIIARRQNMMITSVTECAICAGQPADSVLPQYIQSDPTRAPIPLEEPEMAYLYEDEEELAKSGKPWTGMLKPLFRILGWPQDEEPKPEPRSKTVARRKKNTGLFEQ